MKFNTKRHKTDEKVFSICINKHIYTGGSDGMLRDITRNKILYKHNKSITHITTSGEYLASSSYDCTVFIYKQGILEDVIEGPETEIKCVAFDELNQNIALSTRGKTVWVCTINKQEGEKDLIEIDTILEDHSEDVKGCVFYQGMLVTYGYDCTIKVYQYFETTTWELVQNIEVDSTIWDLIFIDDRMYFCTDSGEIICYKLRQGWEYERRRRISCTPIYTLSKYKNLIICPVNIGNIVFLSQQLEIVDFIEKIHHDTINCVYWSELDNLIGTCSDDKSYCIIQE